MHTGKQLNFHLGGSVLQRQDFGRGFWDTLPLGLGVTIYGLVYGILGRQGNLPFWFVVGMSLLVFAGSSQIMALQMMISGAGALSTIFTVLIVNLRHLIMAADLSVYLQDASAVQKLRNAFFLTDESYTAAYIRFRTSGASADYMFGCGMDIYCFWVLSSAAGYLFGNLIPSILEPALSFAMAAAFLSMLLPVVKDFPTIAAVLTSAITAVVGAIYLPGKWYIVLSAFAGSSVGFLCGELSGKRRTA